jgi:hypothetical protein
MHAWWSIALVSACIPSDTQSEELVTAPAVAAGDSGYLVVWADLTRDTTGDLMTSRLVAKQVTTGGTVGSAVLVSTAGGDPAVAWDGTQWVVAYVGEATRVSSAGAIAGITTLPVVPAAVSVAGLLDPDLACDGTTCLIVQTGGTGVVGMRMDHTGTLLDAAPFVIAASGLAPRVAFDGSQFWVVWQEPVAYPFYVLQGARVTSSGTVLDAQPVVIDPQVAGGAAIGSASREAIACHAGTCLVGYEAMARRVSSTGVVLDTSPIATVSSCDVDQFGIAFDGTSFIVGGACFQSMEGVHGARVSSDGVVLGAGELVVSGAASQTIGFAVAATTGSSLGVWEDRRDGEDIYGTRIDDTGTVLDPGGVHIGARGE